MKVPWRFIFAHFSFSIYLLAVWCTLFGACLKVKSGVSKSRGLEAVGRFT